MKAKTDKARNKKAKQVKAARSDTEVRRKLGCGAGLARNQGLRIQTMLDGNAALRDRAEAVIERAHYLLSRPDTDEQMRRRAAAAIPEAKAIIREIERDCRKLLKAGKDFKDIKSTTTASRK